mmetsp:Transcript_30720/g.34277  ORF Transcript_30720/g.34277 Transcript_30720/m.34277 type:complete len:178 (+) Transcript_30720:1-534(+)
MAGECIYDVLVIKTMLMAVMELMGSLQEKAAATCAYYNRFAWEIHSYYARLKKPLASSVYTKGVDDLASSVLPKRNTTQKQNENMMTMDDPVGWAIWGEVFLKLARNFLMPQTKSQVRLYLDTVDKAVNKFNRGLTVLKHIEKSQPTATAAMRHTKQKLQCGLGYALFFASTCNSRR